MPNLPRIRRLRARGTGQVVVRPAPLVHELSASDLTWVNVAFSFRALTLLADDATTFIDEAFKQGLAARSASLGDPTDPEDEGNPQNWVIGGPDNEADVDRKSVV